MMKFEGWNDRETNLWKNVSILTHLRKNNPVLMYGEFINLRSNKDNWIYARKYFDKNAIVFINNSSKPENFELNLPSELNTEGLKSTFNHKFTISNRKISVLLPPYSSEILL